MKPPTQCERLLGYLLEYGTIDPLTAWTELGIYRLAARVRDLRDAGHIIAAGHKQVKNRWGETASVANYRLQR